MTARRLTAAPRAWQLLQARRLSAALRPLRRLGRAALAAAIALAAGACNDSWLFGRDHQDPPPDREPPDWDGTFGDDHYFYFWRIATDQAGNEKGRIYRHEIGSSSAPEPFWSAPSGKCVGCHSVSRDGRYMAVVELTNRLGLDPTIHVVDLSVEPPVEVEVPGGPITGTFTSWRPVGEGEVADRFVLASPYGLQIASVSSGLLMTLTATAADGRIASQPSWGPDDRIVYAGGRYGDSRIVLYQESEIWSIRADGTGNELLHASSGRMSYFPEISPDGEWIAFTDSPSSPESSTFSSTTSRIRLLRLEDGEVRNPDDLNASSSAGRTWATWSAVGNRLTCGTADGSGDSDIHMTHFDPETGLDWEADRIDEISTDRFEHLPRWAP